MVLAYLVNMDDNLIKEKNKRSNFAVFVDYANNKYGKLNIKVNFNIKLSIERASKTKVTNNIYLYFLTIEIKFTFINNIKNLQIF